MISLFVEGSVVANDFGEDATHFISLPLVLYVMVLLQPSHSRLRATDRCDCKNISP